MLQLTSALESKSPFFSKPFTFSKDVWYKLQMKTGSKMAGIYLNGEFLIEIKIPKDVPVKGFVGYGTSSVGIADFDNLAIA